MTMDQKKLKSVLIYDSETGDFTWLAGRRTGYIGYKGVRYDERRDKYMANIKKDNKSHFLGYYETVEEAAQAYTNAAKQLHKEFAYV